MPKPCFSVLATASPARAAIARSIEPSVPAQEEQQREQGSAGQQHLQDEIGAKFLAQLA